MPEYEYEVIDRNGQVVKGQAEAVSVTDLVRGLSSEGHTVVEVNERRAGSRAPIFRRRSRPQDHVVAFHELATLLESGVSLADAVLAQARGSSHPELASAFDAIARSLLRGQSFRESLRAGGLSLPHYVYFLVEAGELSGHLAEALRQAVVQMQHDLRTAAEVRSALTYPAILIASGFAAVLLVFVFVIPQFSNPPRRRRRAAPSRRGGPSHRGLVQRERIAPRRPARRRRGGGRRALPPGGGTPARPGLPRRPAGPRKLVL